MIVDCILLGSKVNCCKQVDNKAQFPVPRNGTVANISNEIVYDKVAAGFPEIAQKFFRRRATCSLTRIIGTLHN